MRFLQGKSLVLVIIGVILIIGLLLTLYSVGQRQDDRGRAAASTTLSFNPSTTSTTPLQANPNQILTFDIMINPGTNQVSFVQLELLYSPTIFGGVGATPIFQPNTTVLPTTIEGPNFSSGRVTVSMSVGNDLTKVITTPVKIGTLTLQTLTSTPTPSQITFGPLTKVLSIAPSDQASENVLATSSPAYVAVAAPTPTPLPTNTPTPTSLPTNTPTPTRTPTPLPTNTPTPTRTPTPLPTNSPTPLPTNTPTPIPVSTKLGMTMLLHGIGSAGDNANPTNSSLSNKNPLRPTRSVNVLVYDSTNTLIRNVIANVSYNQVSGNFTGLADLGTGLASGQYIVKLKTDQFLRRAIPGFITINAGSTLQLPTATMVSGDINNDNAINILDYNTLIGCYSDIAPPTSCTAAQKLAADLNDDGNVNQFDYNLFLRELSVQLGE